MLFFSVSLADTGDSGGATCPDDSIPVDARFESGTCIADLAAYCAGACISWEEVLALERASPDSNEVMDCVPPSPMAHRWITDGTEWRRLSDYDAGGELVGIDDVQFSGTPWCCEGQVAYRLQAGAVGGECLLGGDSGDTEDTSGTPDESKACACGRGCDDAGRGESGLASLAFVILVSRRRRKSPADTAPFATLTHQAPRSRNEAP